MTHHKVTIFIASLSLLLFSSVVFGQETTAKTKPVDTERRQKAVELLESLATQVTSLQSAENRARIGANIAESLWKDNEKRARALFTSIEDDISLGLQNRDLKDPEDALSVRVFLKLRGDTVQRIAKYDPEFALTFLSVTTPQDEEITRMFTGDQRSLEIQLAKQIATTNPDIALKLGRQSLARGLTVDLLPVLRQLHRKHRDKGVTLYKEVVQKVRETDLTEDWEASEFARTLVQSFEPPVADESAYRELVNKLLTTALKADCDKQRKDDEDGETFCDQISSLVPIMAKVDPLRARKLKNLTPENSEESWAPLAAAYVDLEEVAADGNVDDILALAEKYPDIDISIYSTAMTKAYESGDIERAKKIANAYPGNPESREMLQEQVKRAAAISEMTIEQAMELQKQSLEQLGLKPKRAQILIGLAGNIGPANKLVALKVLDEAFELVEGIKAPGEKIRTRLYLASLYCSQGSDRGLEIVQSQIPKLNELIDAAIKLDGFDTNYLRDGEWNMSANGEIGSLLTTMSQNAGSYAWCDFDRAVSLAGQFERNEIRIMAQVKLAQSILAGPSTRSPNMHRQYIEFSLSH